LARLGSPGTVLENLFERIRIAVELMQGAERCMAKASRNLESLGGDQGWLGVVNSWPEGNPFRGNSGEPQARLDLAEMSRLASLKGGHMGLDEGWRKVGTGAHGSRSLLETCLFRSAWLAAALLGTLALL